jgi:hypothetical protein
MRVTPQVSRLISVFRTLSLAALILAVRPAMGQELQRAPQRERTAADLGQLTRQSALIVHGAVSSREVKWVGRVLYTFYTLSVWETLQGDARSNVVVAVPGGTLGNVQLSVPDAPRIADGDEVVVFGERFQNQSAFAPVGRFDGLITTRQGPDDTKFAVPGIGKPERLDEFLKRVRSLTER